VAFKSIEIAWREERGMKQRSTIIAVWLALFIAIGVVLAQAMTDTAGDDFVLSPPPEPTAGSAHFRVWPQATEVRLFVEDLSFDEQRRTGAWTSRPEGILLTANQRKIVDSSIYLNKMTKREAEKRMFAACFVPHHFFRYYDRAGRQIGELQICYCCAGIAMNPALRPESIYEEWQFDFDAVEKMLKEMGVPTDVNC
jgi:hypothetical protein